MKRRICILLIGDQIDMLKFSHYYLSTIDYNVLNAKTSLQGIKLARELLPHLIIIDEMMADMSGIETCREIRKIPDLFETKIIFLSEDGEDQNQIAGYDAGLDDFVTKPIKPKVLTSKIKAFVRNFNESESSLDAITLGNLVINKEEYTITNGKTKYDLPKKNLSYSPCLPHLLEGYFKEER